MMSTTPTAKASAPYRPAMAASAAQPAQQRECAAIGGEQEHAAPEQALAGPYRAPRYGLVELRGHLAVYVRGARRELPHARPGADPVLVRAQALHQHRTESGRQIG